MAFGFTPKFEQSLGLNGLDPEHYLVVALEAAKQLGWDTTNVGKTGFSAYTGFSMLSWNEEVSINIEDSNVNLQSKCLGNQIFDWGKNKDNIENFIAEFDKTQSSLSEEQINEKLITTTGDPKYQADSIQNETPATSLGKARGFFSFFIPRAGYFISPIIVNINLLVFILMVISGVSVFEPTTANLISWGADFRPITLDGQWWRLLTSVFLHIGILHILFNMYALLYIGLLLEPYLGKLRFGAAYLFTGILASLTSICWHPLTVSAGASGAIFGMYGVFLAMLTTNIIDKKTRSALFDSIGIFVVFNLMNGTKAGIDNAAHIGGLVSGLIIGYAYYPGLKRPQSLNLKYTTIGLLFVATLTTLFVIYHNIPNGFGEYNAKMKDFSKREAIALEVFKMKNVPDSVLLSAINDEGIANWRSNLKTLDEADKLDITMELTDRIALLRKYCNLRITSYNLIYKEVKENTKQYNLSIDSCNKAIEGLVDSLKKQ